MNGFDICVIGEILIDFLPGHRGPLRDAKLFEIHSGGAPANVALGVARLGGTACLISRLGDDEFGRLAVSRLREDGVNCDSVRFIKHERSALCFVTLDATGERSFTHRGGDPFGSLNSTDLDITQIRQARAISFSCGALRTHASMEAVHVAMKTATGLICCDPGGFPPSWGDEEDIGHRVRSVASQCHIFKCAADEAARYFGIESPDDAARHIQSTGAVLAIVTDGSNGAFFARSGDAGHVPAPTAVVVDTTGAGDAFMAGLLTSVTRDGMDPKTATLAAIEEAIAFACRVGAAAVTRRGAVTGIPRLEHGERFPLVGRSSIK